MKIDDWETFEKSNPTTALNILYFAENEICAAYISKTNSNSEKQIILLMISNEEKEGWHYLALKKFALLHGRSFRGDFYCLSCFLFLKQKINLNIMKKYVKIKPLAELQYYQKNYADIESLNRWICKYSRKFLNSKNWRANSLEIFSVGYMGF